MKDMFDQIRPVGLLNGGWCELCAHSRSIAMDPRGWLALVLAYRLYLIKKNQTLNK